MPTARKKSKAKPKAKPKPAKPKAKVVPKAAPKAKPAPAAPAKPAKAAAAQAPPAAKAPSGKPGGKPSGPKKGGRKSGLLQRRGPNGELLSPGDILLPGGAQGTDETQYLLRGVVAAEHSAGGEAGVSEILSRRPTAGDSDKADLSKVLHTVHHRFEAGPIEPSLPPRPPSPRRTFQTVVERAKHRRREIGAFLRGLDIGRTETSHMDSHGEASLQSLMEWAARLENLAEADEPDQADYAMFHRGLDQLESTTEALIVDVELTLRRLRDRNRAS